MWVLYYEVYTRHSNSEEHNSYRRGMHLLKPYCLTIVITLNIIVFNQYNMVCLLAVDKTSTI